MRGTGIGIIDTLHLTDVVYAADKLSVLGALPDDVLSGLKKWFSEYSDWLLHSRNGQDERGNGNNHTICYYVQLAAFSLFTEDRETVEVCRDAYKNELLYQMEDNGSFPAELNRTKPYNYSVFTLDNMVSLCHMLSEPENNLWEFSLPGGRSIKKGLDFMMPYLLDKSAWPYPKDVMHFESYPARFSMMIFAGCTLGIRNLIDLYDRLPADITDEEVRRNSAVLYPLLWM
jgi:hypothetical protein